MAEISNVTQSYAMVSRTWLAAAAFSGAVLAISACSSDSTSPREATGTSNPTDSASSLVVAPEDIEDPSAAAAAAYERYWRTVADATSIPDPDYAELDEVAAGQALDWARSLVQGGVDEKQRGTGYPSHDAEVTDFYPTTSPTELAIDDCMDSRNWLVLDAASGDLVTGEEYGTSKVSALVERVDDRWLVTEIIKQGIGTCLSSSRPASYAWWGSG